MFTGLFGDQARDLPACCIVPQPTTLPQFPLLYGKCEVDKLCTPDITRGCIYTKGRSKAGRDVTQKHTKGRNRAVLSVMRQKFSLYVQQYETEWDEGFNFILGIITGTHASHRPSTSQMRTRHLPPRYALTLCSENVFCQMHQLAAVWTVIFSVCW
jgi:hypothetical protein